MKTPSMIALLGVALLVVGLGSCGGAKPFQQSDPDQTGLTTGDFNADAMNQVAEYFADHLLQNRNIVQAENTVRVNWLGCENRTSRQFDAGRLTQRIESKLSAGGWNRNIQFVADREMRNLLAEEISDQQSPMFDRNQVVRVGKMKGAQYVLYGTIYGERQVTDDARQIDYEVFIELINVETGEKWTDEKRLRYSQER